MRDINLYNIQLMDLELFLNTAKYGRFTQAGEIMFVSQSWVSKRISFMEQELGLQLFIRSNRRLTLTPAGHVLARRLDSITDKILDSIQEAHTVQKGAAGYLKIGFLDWMQNPFLGKLEHYMDCNPQIFIDVFFQQFSELKENLLADRTDLIFTVSYDVEELSEAEYHIVPVERIPLIAYVSRKNPLSQKESIKVKDLRPEQMLMLDPRACKGYSKYINGLFSANEVIPMVHQYAVSGREHIGNILLNRGILLASRNFLGNTYEDSIASLEVEDAPLYLTVSWKKQNPNPVIPVFLKEVAGLRL